MVSSFARDDTAEQVAAALSHVIEGKTVIVTGASPKGLGAECTRVLAKYAGLIILTGRSQERLDQTIESIKQETPSANLRPLVFDLSSFASIRSAAAQVNKYAEPIHVLINNAAVAACPYGLTEDGFETQFGSNHLGHFLFTALIFPKLVASSSSAFPARIVNVSSGGHRYSPVRFEDLGFSGGEAYDPSEGYGQSKTANILFSDEIARRAETANLNVISFSLHPGVIKTPLDRHLTLDYLIQKEFANPDGTRKGGEPMKSLEAGTATHIVAAFDPSIKGQSGAYLCDNRVAEDRRSLHATGEENGRRLWALSEALVDCPFDIARWNSI